MVSDFIKSIISLDTAQLNKEMENRFYDKLKDRHKPYSGADGMTAKRYRQDPFPIIHSIQRQICSPSKQLDAQGKPKTPTRFVYTPFLQFEVPKRPRSKDTRKLSKASIRNILAQKMIAKFMTPIMDQGFIEHSYAYRPKKSAKQALRQVQKLIKEGYVHVLDADISKYFDNVRHDILLGKVENVFPNEPELLHLIYRFMKTGWINRPNKNSQLQGKLRSPIIKDEAGQILKGNYHSRKLGIPQGGILSGLLANLYLNDFDHAIQAKFPNVRYVRYADDFLIFCRTLNEYQSVRAFVETYLIGQLGLELNLKKTDHRQIAEPRLKKAEPFVDFLGYRVCENRIKIQPKNIRAYKDKMTEVINDWLKSEGLVGTLIRRINGKIKGRLYERSVETGSTLVCRNWTAYFSLITGHGQLKELDDWLWAAILRAIKAKKIKYHTRQILRNRKLITLVRLHYKMKQERARQAEQREQQLQLQLSF